MSSGIRKQDAFIPSPEGEGNSRLFVKLIGVRDGQSANKVHDAEFQNGNALLA